MNAKALLLLAVALSVGSVLLINQTFPQILAVVPSPTTPYGFTYVVNVWMENKNYGDVIGNSCCPYETALAAQGATNTRYGQSSNGGSLPNYIGFMSGQVPGAVGSNCSPSSSCSAGGIANLVDRLETAGLTWKAFAEDYPIAQGCSQVGDNPSSFPHYYARHFPFNYFTDISGARCNNLLRASASSDPEFLSVLNQGSGWPNFVWLTPNGVNDGHDNGAGPGEVYLAALVPQILASNLFKTGRAALVITWDEYGNSPWIAAGPAVKLAYSFATSNTHYNWLKTVLDNWGLNCLSSDCGLANMFEFLTAGATTACTNGATNPPLCNVCPPGQQLIGGICQAPPPPPSGPGTFNSSWVLAAPSPGVASISNGVLTTTVINPGGSYTGSYYAVGLLGSAPYFDRTGRQYAPVLATQNVNALLSANLTWNTLTRAGSSQAFNVEVSLYYKFTVPLATLPAGNGCTTPTCSSWLDTQVRFSQGSSGNTYTPGDSLGWAELLPGLISPGQSYNLASWDLWNQHYLGALRAWGIPVTTTATLMGMEVGVEGYGLNPLTATWYSTRISTGPCLTCAPPITGLSFTSTPSAPIVNTPISFRDAVTGGTAPFYYTWNFGDGSPTATGNPSIHTFASSGTFMVSLIIVDSLARTGSAQLSVIVSPALPACVPPQPSFTYAVTPPGPPTVGLSSFYFTPTMTGGNCVPDSFAWKAVLNGQVITTSNGWNWGFGLVTSPGNYTVTFTVTDSASPPNTASFSQTIGVLNTNILPGTCSYGGVYPNCNPPPGPGFSLSTTDIVVIMIAGVSVVAAFSVHRRRR